MSNQRLKVAGVENIEITDPARLSGRRKKLDQRQTLKGKALTAKELKGIFGYASTTALADTQLARLVEPVNKKITNPYQEKSTLWRIK